MRALCIVVIVCLVGWSNSQKCPARYRRFSPRHSFCLPPNPTCEIQRTGVSEQDKELILRLHNQFRSKVAMGNEHRSLGGSMPQAADMLQMVWDEELAAVAQKWTENCNWGHDCQECRAVENFGVGQNLFIQDWTPCDGHGCIQLSSEPNWRLAITFLYDEVKDYNINWIDSFKPHNVPKKTGHLTQLIWSKTWRVGCGVSYYKKGGENHLYYACNYGPGGNIETQPVYKQGQPCSACPTNTQCSTTSERANSFPGLCKMVDPNTAPAYPKSSRSLFLCGSMNNDNSNCEYEGEGHGQLKSVHSVGGNYRSIVLNGGQSINFTFVSPIVPRGSTSCLSVIFRKGPLDASRKDRSKFQANFKLGFGTVPPMDIDTKTTVFKQFRMELQWRMKTKLGFTFSVPRGAGKHVLDIGRIEAFDGSCS
ncbi:CRISP/Allergen/PR-1-like [Argiope bruennichi]|uniref:CRISP/Allergen/PR-1-like n=1 Tax=Argiope bruennichi TaxID=94029 RepID=UPI002494B67F|nr:CRISP/Allergen/PR-1-like [Argiope bruennichi]